MYMAEHKNVLNVDGRCVSKVPLRLQTRIQGMIPRGMGAAGSIRISLTSMVKFSAYLMAAPRPACCKRDTAEHRYYVFDDEK